MKLMLYFHWLLICFSISCAQDKASRPSQEFTGSAVMSSFLSSTGEVGMSYLSQTVEIIIRNSRFPFQAYKTSGVIVDNVTMLTSAHLFAPFHVRVNEYMWMTPFELAEITIKDVWGKEILRTLTNLNSFFNGMNPDIVAFTPVNPFDLASKPPHFYAHQDIALIRLKNTNFSRLTGIEIRTIKPTLRYPQAGTQMYTIGFAKGEGNLKAHATRFDVDSQLGIGHSEYVNILTRRTQPSPLVQHNDIGDSGGPLIWVDKNNRPHLFGLITSGIVNDAFIEDHFTGFAEESIVNLLFQKKVAIDPELDCIER